MMTQTELRELVNRLTDQEFEALIRTYAGRQLRRLLETPSASKYYCSIGFWWMNVEQSRGHWIVKGIIGANTKELKGEVLTMTVDQLLEMINMDEKNKLNVLTDEMALYMRRD